MDILGSAETVKEAAKSNHMTLGKIMDLMNRDYDTNDPKFMQEVQLRIYQHASENSMAAVVPKLEDNMVTKPETIGLEKDNHCLDNMERSINAMKQVYSNNKEEERTRTR